MHGRMVLGMLVPSASIALSTIFLLAGLTAPVASASASNRVTSDAIVDLARSSHIGPLNVQQAPPLTRIIDGSDHDETMSSISAPFGLSDCLMPPLLPRKEAQSPPQSPGPGPDDQSEYMIGDVAVTVIFPESNGTIDPSKENWSSSRMGTCISEITAGLTWWQNREPKANLNFAIYSYYDEPTSYEPISRQHTDQGLWIDEILTGLGYTSGSYFDKVRDLNNAQRSLYNKDWAYTIFVVDSLNDADGEFTDGWFAYACDYGGPFLVMTYDNDNYGINDMDVVAAHETGHIFYATDEYDGIPEYSGYLNIQDDENANCIMRGQVNWNLCSSTKGQVGWRDSDGDGILDAVDTFPDTVLDDPYSPDPTKNSILLYTGTVQDVPLSNSNPKGPGNDVSINTITAVQYRIDYGTWYNANSTDGAFDKVTEIFSFATPL